MGIDIGTTSVKAVAVDGDGRVLARSRLRYGARIPAPGRLEHDARRAWWEGPRQALAAVVGTEAVAEVGVSAVAVSAMAPTITAVDGSGCPLGPGVLYDDERGRPSPLAGAPTDPTQSDEMVRLLAWAAGSFPAARGYWPAQAVANRALGGRSAIDLATAFSAGPLFGADGWDRDRCAAAGADPAQLPEVVLFGEAVGEATALGPTASGQAPLVVAGGVDAFCEQLVAGSLEVGDVLVVCGSTLVVWVVTDQAASSAAQAERREQGEQAERGARAERGEQAEQGEQAGRAGGEGAAGDGLWRLPDLTPGRMMVGGPSNAGGLFLDWVDRILRPAQDGTGGTQDASSGRDTDSLDPAAIPVWRPYLRGERVPLHDPDLRGSLAGLDLTHGPEALRRAAYEASAMALRSIVERAGSQPKRIVATGGGVRVRGWLQAIADVTGTTVEPVAVPEGAALGAAWLARMGAGLETRLEDAQRWASAAPAIEPVPAWADACAARYERSHPSA